jgi:hypothetical protein
VPPVPPPGPVTVTAGRHWHGAAAAAAAKKFHSIAVKTRTLTAKPGCRRPASGPVSTAGPGPTCHSGTARTVTVTVLWPPQTTAVVTIMTRITTVTATAQAGYRDQ